MNNPAERKILLFSYPLVVSLSRQERFILVFSYPNRRDHVQKAIVRNEV